MPKEVGMDPLAIYMREISRYELLSAAEEIELAGRIAHGDEQARHFMVQANLRLVVKISRRYMNRGVALPDLIEEGNIGLIRAVEKFDVAHGCRFSTYATWWIRQAVERAIMNQSRTIRIPVHVAKEYLTLMNQVARLRAALGREPDQGEIAAALDMSVEHVQELQNVEVHTDSVDEQLNDEGGFTLYDITADESAEVPGERLQIVRRNEMLQGWMQQLTPKEREVVRLRYGLGDSGEPWTLEEIGEHLGVTRERIRQIQVQSLQKLRRFVARDEIGLEEIL